MSEKTLIKYCSPTLAGLKTGNLFSCLCSDLDELCAEISIFNNILNQKGVYIFLLRVFNNKALIYVCRLSRLKSDLSKSEVQNLLAQNGYDCKNTNDCIRTLSCRLSAEGGFPHEIGLFLGYPLPDVKGFIENQGRNCKYTGCWKVYSDEQKALTTFAKYEKCTKIYATKLNKGFSIQKLTVAV